MFFLFTFVGCAILSGVMEGGGGIASTPLTAAIDDDDAVLLVTSTDGFLDTDYVTISNETILYAGKTDTSFTGCTRGAKNTTAVTHDEGDMIYTTSASIANHTLNFNIAAMVDSMGFLAFPAVVLFFFTKTVPQFIMWNWSFLSGDLMIIGLFFFMSGAALIITIALMLVGARRV